MGLQTLSVPSGPLRMREKHPQTVGDPQSGAHLAPSSLPSSSSCSVVVGTEEGLMYGPSHRAAHQASNGAFDAFPLVMFSVTVPGCQDGPAPPGSSQCSVPKGCTFPSVLIRSLVFAYNSCPTWRPCPSLRRM